MPAWITSLFREDVSVPMPSAASSTSTSRPAWARARATASPTTPAPTTMQSTDSTCLSRCRSDLPGWRAEGKEVTGMLTLSAGQSSLVLAPEAGGAIVGWSWGRFPVLRRPLPEALLHDHARGLAAYPLVPFSNRIANARFRFDGQVY